MRPDQVKPPSIPQRPAFHRRLLHWLLHDFLGIVKEMRLSYIPPLMVYFAAGVSGFTGIIESFYVKKELGLSAAFLAGLGFWTGLPWTLKMPIGHLVDLCWRRKALFVYFGALLMAASLLIMVGVTGYRHKMELLFAAETWYVLAMMLAPVGFVIQDVVADAMTVEAVPTHDESGTVLSEAEQTRMHTTMQTLGRIAIIGGSALVAGVGGWLAKILSYKIMYEVALIIPLISVAGVTLGQLETARRRKRLAEKGRDPAAGESILPHEPGGGRLNPHILGGSAAFIALSLFLGLSDLALKKELMFIASLAVIVYLMRHVLFELPLPKRREIVAIAVIIFVFRAMPTAGPGASWWQIDVLDFDEAFFGTLRQVASIFTIIGLFALRGWMSRRSISYLVVFLSIYNSAMLLPFIGMFYGLHEWTEAVFGFGARTIAIIDTMADSPLGQVVMVPMLAWIAREAPSHQKATYFAVMAAFTNLALSASHLLTNYCNRLYVIDRGEYNELGYLMISVAVIGAAVPIATVFLMEFWQKISEKGC